MLTDYSGMLSKYKAQVFTSNSSKSSLYVHSFSLCFFPSYACVVDLSPAYLHGVSFFFPSVSEGVSVTLMRWLGAACCYTPVPFPVTAPFFSQHLVSRVYKRLETSVSE